MTELGRRNRRLIAERADWPDGAVEACEKIEDEYPEWVIWWAPENPAKGFEHDAGFFATPAHYVHRSARRRHFGATPEELSEALGRGL